MTILQTPPAGVSVAPAAGPGTVASGRRPREIWRAVRLPAIVVVVVLAGGFILGVSSGRFQRGSLDPRAVDPAGSRALATLLQDRGVTVHRVYGVAAAVEQADSTSTVFVPFPEYEASTTLQKLQTMAGTVRFVVIDPSDRALNQVTAEISTKSYIGVRRRDPRCPLPEARTAGDADLGGGTYTLLNSGVGERCYGGSLATAHTRTGQPVAAVGAPEPFTNDRLGSRGNAALAIGLLGGADDLWWVLPDLSAGSSSGDQPSLFDILPAWVSPVIWQLLLAGLLLALWRGRRLGPVVIEALPVVVRAAESVEGRARLYRRARARDRAADALRGGARARIVPFLGLGADPAPPTLVSAVAARAGRSPDEVAALLFGGAPADDAGLVRLADALDALIRTTLDREGRRL